MGFQRVGHNWVTDIQHNWLFPPWNCPSSKFCDITVFFLFILLNFMSVILLVGLGLRCCTWAFCSCGKWRLLCSFNAWASHCRNFSCCGAQALGVRASVVAACGLSSCGWQAPEHGLSSWFRSLVCSVGLPGPGIESLSPALAGRFLSAVPPGKSSSVVSDAGAPSWLLTPFITYSLLQGSLPVSWC